MMVLGLAGCPATDNQITGSLTAAGFTQIQDEGTAIIGCVRGEVGSKFSAMNGAGARVRGVVCCGGYTPLNKGCTIRFTEP